MAHPHDEVILWIDSYSSLAPFTRCDGSAGKIGDKMCTEHLQRLSPASIDGCLPLSHASPADPKPPQRRSKIGSFFRRIFKCFCLTPPLSEPGLPASSGARDELSDMELRRLPPVQFYSPSAFITTVPSSSSTEAPSSPVASDAETSSSIFGFIASGSNSSSGASATSDDDVLEAAPAGRPLLSPLTLHPPYKSCTTAAALA